MRCVCIWAQNKQLCNTSLQRCLKLHSQAKAFFKEGEGPSSPSRGRQHLELCSITFSNAAPPLHGEQLLQILGRWEGDQHHRKFYGHICSTTLTFGLLLNFVLLMIVPVFFFFNHYCQCSCECSTDFFLSPP